MCELFKRPAVIHGSLSMAMYEIDIVFVGACVLSIFKMRSMKAL